MTKNKIWILMSATALIVLTGCNLPFINKAPKAAMEKTAKNVVEERADDNAEDSNDYEEPETNIDECLKGCVYLDGAGMFSKEFCTDSCWAGVAKDTGDASICDNKVSKDNDLVLTACYMNAAETAKNAKPCDKIGKDSSDIMRAACYSTVAKITKNPSICDSIKGSMMFEYCVSDAKGE